MLSYSRRMNDNYWMRVTALRPLRQSSVVVKFTHHGCQCPSCVYTVIWALKIVAITYSNQTTNSLWIWPYSYFYSLEMAATSVTGSPRSSASHHACSSWVAHSWPPYSHAVQYGAPSPSSYFSYAYTMVVFTSSDTNFSRKISRYFLYNANACHINSWYISKLTKPKFDILHLTFCLS